MFLLLQKDKGHVLSSLQEFFYIRRTYLSLYSDDV